MRLSSVGLLALGIGRAIVVGHLADLAVDYILLAVFGMGPGYAPDGTFVAAGNKCKQMHCCMGGIYECGLTL